MLKMPFIFGIIDSTKQEVNPIAFVSNTNQQLMLTDSAFHLTEREKKFLEKSWNKIFAEKVFPAIDEDIQ